MDTVKIIFHQKTLQLPRITDSADISILFNVNIDGLHVRCKSRSGWITVWPSNNSLVFSEDISEGYLIATEVNQLKTTQDLSRSPGSMSSESAQISTISTPSNASNFMFNRRGDLGSRAVPSLKRSSTPAPLKRRKIETPCYKTITLTDIVEEEVSNIYDVPIDLNKLEKCKTDFTIDNVQKEFAFQVGCQQSTFIITNKKGLPIRDMPNTRGMLYYKVF